jgi:hypothetical protein
MEKKGIFVLQQVYLPLVKPSLGIETINFGRKFDKGIS